MHRRFPSKRLERLPSLADILIGLAVFHAIAPSMALAYLDPITGSVVLQILAAGFLAAIATFRKSRDWLTNWLRRLTKSGPS